MMLSRIQFRPLYQLKCSSPFFFRPPVISWMKDLQQSKGFQQSCATTVNYNTSMSSHKLSMKDFSANVLSSKMYPSLLLHDTRDFSTSNSLDSKALTVLNLRDLKELRRSPVAALALGFSGLIPFVFPAAYMIKTGVFSAAMTSGQLAYGACILSFLGGKDFFFHKNIISC